MPGVHLRRDDHNQEPDTQTRDQPAAVKVIQTLCTRLQRTTNNEDDRPHQHRLLPAQPVTARSGKTGAHERAAREDGNHSAFLGFTGGELVLEVFGGHYTGDDAEVVTEEGGAQGGEETDQELVPFRWERWRGEVLALLRSSGMHRGSAVGSKAYPA